MTQLSFDARSKADLAAAKAADMARVPNHLHVFENAADGLAAEIDRIPEGKFKGYYVLHLVDTDADKVFQTIYCPVLALAEQKAREFCFGEVNR